VIFAVGLLLLALIGVPLFALLGAVALILFLEQPAGSWSAPAIDVFGSRFAQNPTLMAIPLFAFAGHALSCSGLPERVARRAWVYFGLLPLILYGVVAGVAIERALVAAIVPGLLMLCVVATHGALARTGGAPARQPFPTREVLASLWENRRKLAIPAALVACIAVGLLRVHEGAALTALYVLVVELFVRRDGHAARDLPRVLVESTVLTGAVLVVLVTALGVNAWIAQDELSARVASQALFGGAAVFLLAINGLLLLVGAALDVFTAIAVVAPLILPLAEGHGVDPYHMAVIFLLNLGFGRIMREAYETARPLACALAGALLVVTYAPALSTWLPGQILE
jgi:TRAP-type C4-dicarboxylate transport system permease large subunit